MQQQPAGGTRALGILHFSLLVGQLVFAAITWYLHSSGTITLTNLGDHIQYIVIGVAAAGLLLAALSFYVYRKKIAALKESVQPAKEKLNAYRAACLTRWAMLEAPVLLALIAFMLTGNYNLLVLAGAILLLFITTRPTASKAAAALSLSEEEVNS